MEKSKKRKSIKVWVSDEERALIEVKQEHYGYRSLAAYIRDAAIYEKVTYVNIKQENEIYEAFAKYAKELNSFKKDINFLIKFLTQIDETEINNLKVMLKNISKNQRKILELIDKKLDLEVWQEINHNK